jgi:hypothetical protein
MGWWVSSDEENYQGPYDSRDEAVRTAVREGLGSGFNGCDDCSRFYVVRAGQGPVDMAPYIDADAVLQSAMEAIDDDYGGEDGLDWDRFWTSEQERRLDRLLRWAVRLWQWWYGVRVRTWQFTRCSATETYTHVEGFGP